MSKIFDHPSALLDAIGVTLGPTPWLVIEQERINLFAAATDDHQWIHVDQEQALNGPFGACIAHGYLTLSLANRFLPELIQVQQTTMGVNYGCGKVRFPNVVKVGQKLRGTADIIEANAKGANAVQVVVRITIEIEGEERPACVVDTISRFYFAEEN